MYSCIWCYYHSAVLVLTGINYLCCLLLTFPDIPENVSRSFCKCSTLQPAACFDFHIIDWLQTIVRFYWWTRVDYMVWRLLLAAFIDGCFAKTQFMFQPTRLHTVSTSPASLYKWGLAKSGPHLCRFARLAGTVCNGVGWNLAVGQ